MRDERVRRSQPRCGSPGSDHPAVPRASPGRWDGAVTTAPRVEDQGAGWRCDSLGGSRAATSREPNPNPGAAAPKAQPLSSRGEGSERGLALRWSASRACSFCSSTRCRVAHGRRVLRLGSWLVCPCLEKNHFLQPALAEPCEWRTSGFLQWFEFAESCFAFSSCTA